MDRSLGPVSGIGDGAFIWLFLDKYTTFTIEVTTRRRLIKRTRFRKLKVTVINYSKSFVKNRLEQECKVKTS